MSTLLWNDVLQGAEANKGSVPLQPGDYNFKLANAEGKTAQSGREMISVRLEIIDGPYAGKTAWHNWVLPNDNSDKAKTSLGYFLGDMEVFGLTKEWFQQNIGNQPITKATCDFIAAQLINHLVTATVTLQKGDSSRNDIKKFRALEAQPGFGAPAAAPQFAPAQSGPVGVPQPQFAQPNVAAPQQAQPQYALQPQQSQFAQAEQAQFGGQPVATPQAAPQMAQPQFAQPAPAPAAFVPPQVNF